MSSVDLPASFPSMERLNELGLTQLTYAAKEGDADSVRSLLDAGRDVNEPTGHENFTAIHYACKHHQVDALEALVSWKNTDLEWVTSLGDSPLMTCVYHGFERGAEMLLAAGANVDVSNNFGNTALNYAAIRGYSMIGELLLEHGADHSARRTGDGWTALHIAANNGELPLVKALVDRQADVNAGANYGESPLMAAIAASMKNHRTTSSILIEAGADVNAATQDNATPLIFAAATGNADLVRLMMTAGADPSPQSKKLNMSALHIACDRNHSEVVRLLLRDNRTNVEARDKDNKTALIICTLNGATEGVEDLLDHRADVDAGDDQGFTSLIEVSVALISVAKTSHSHDS
jgi:ankyrin repeat protein